MRTRRKRGRLEKRDSPFFSRFGFSLSPFGAFGMMERGGGGQVWYGFKGWDEQGRPFDFERYRLRISEIIFLSPSKSSMELNPVPPVVASRDKHSIFKVLDVINKIN